MQGGNSNPGTTSFGQGYNGRAGRDAANQGWGGGGGGGGYYGGWSAGYNTYKSQPNGGSSWTNENMIDEESVEAQVGVQSGNGAAVIEFVSDLPVEEPEEELPEPEEDTTPEDEEPTPTEEVTE